MDRRPRIGKFTAVKGDVIAGRISTGRIEQINAI